MRDVAYAESGLVKKCSTLESLKAVRYYLIRDKAMW